MPITDCILQNGIHLLAEPIAATKAVAIGFWFSRGSRDETIGEYGITHFIEHMMFKGTSSLSAFDIACFFDRIGGYINACTERELVYLYCVVPSQYVNESIQILFSMIRDSVFSELEIEKERTVIISEIVASYDDPEEMGGDLALSFMYPEQGISRPIAGTVKDVNTLDSDHIRSFYQTHFRDNPPVVTIAGNIDINSLITVLENSRTFLSISQTLPVSIKPCWNSGQFFSVSDFSLSQIFLSYPLNSVHTSSDWFSWSLINAIIGDSVSSRLFQTIREQRGLCYSLYSSFNCNRDSAFWSAYVATPFEKTIEATELLLNEIQNIRKCSFGSIEIQHARTHLIGELLLSSEDTENRMKRIARQFFYNKNVDTIDESIEILKSLSVNQVADLGYNSFNSINQSLFVFTDKKQVKECRKKWQ